MSDVHRRGFVIGALSLGAPFPRSAWAADDDLRIAVASNNPPWERQKTDGDFEGFEVDLVNELGKRLHKTIVFQESAGDALFDLADSGRCDVAIGAIAITAARLRTYAFTQAYYDNDLALAARIDANMRTIADAKDATIGALAASPAEAWIREHQPQYRFGDYHSYPRDKDLLFDLRNGRIDAAVGDITLFRLAFVKPRELAIVQSIPTGVRVGLLMRQNNPLLAPVNVILSQLKAEGFLAKLHKKWLGAEADPASSTVRE